MHRVLLSSVWKLHVIQKQSKVALSPQGNIGLAPLTLNSALYGGKWSKSRPGSFNFWEGPRYPLNRRQGRPQNRSGSFGESTTPFCSAGIHTPDRPARREDPHEVLVMRCHTVVITLSRKLLPSLRRNMILPRSGHFPCPQYGGSTYCLLA